MIYNNKTLEMKAAMQTAEMMSAAARTAPKACGIDLIETLVLDGDDKDRLTNTMRDIGQATKRAFFVRDAGNIDNCYCVVLIGSGTKPRGLNCGLCGSMNCAAAESVGLTCAMSVNDLGIAIGSAAATAMNQRIDNRVMFSAGVAALKMGLFSSDVKICFSIGLAIKGKNVFFDRPGQ
ncbi:MAG: DUF2148 domain-containing protein [Dehalococcoidia bacterium]|nr:DUF2148 domain-containing protein [Dehalococcoidia bacterium]